MSVANHETKPVKKKKKPIVKRPPKTLKEKRFLKEYIKTGNGTRAALKVYDTKSYKAASVIATENLEKLSLSGLMDNMGLTDLDLLKCLKDGLYNSKKLFGTPDNYIEVDDKATQHKYLNTAFQLKDKFPKTKLGLEATDGKNTVRVLIEKA